MNKENVAFNLKFLAGGGEMGELTRQKDWSKSPLGKPETWPQSLRTTLSIILNSKFPMFLWWGPELTCFYNDAYRPSLGENGKHPSILGQKAEDAWPEIWAVIKPLIDQVLSGGESTWREDQLIPIYRNGKLEDVYWTFSYSPVKDESDTVAGVLVTCNETTEKVNSLNQIKEHKEQISFTLNAADIATWDLDPATNHFTGNTRIKEWFGIPQDNEIELPIALDRIIESDRQKVREAIQTALKKESGGNYEVRYSIFNPHTKEERNVLAKGKALFTENGEPYRFSGILQDITEEVNTRKKIEGSEQKVRTIVENAPFPIGVYVGKEMRIELANQSILDVWGKGNDVVGKLYSDILPELENQEIFEQLDDVFTTGTPFHATNQRVDLVIEGKLKPYYFNYSFTPLYDSAGAIYGVMNTAANVTDLNSAKQQVEESEKRFRNVVEQAPLGIAIFRGLDFVAEMANGAYLELVDKKESDFVGKPLFDSLPEVKEVVQPLLTDVFKTGIPFHASELGVILNRYGKKEQSYFNLVYHPLREDNGDISGIMVVATEVTGSVIAKQKTQENEQKLNIVIDASELGTWDLDLETKTVIYSDRYIEIFGYKNDHSLTHEQLLKHLHPDDFQVRNAAFERAYETGIFNYQGRIIRHDSSIHWFESKGTVIYDRENKPVKMIGTIRDITEEKNYRQVLLEREQKFRLLADSMPQFVWTSDADGNLNYFNKSVYNYSGLTVEQIEKEGWLQIVHPEEHDENVKQWMQSISTGEVFIFEHRFKRYDGEYRWQLSRAIPQRDEQGNITMWVGTSTDIQDQKLFASELEKQVEERTRDLKKLNEDLIKSEARYHLMIDEVQDYAIIYLNANGDIENWNKGAEKIKGYTAEEIIGKNFSVFYTEPDRKANTPQKLLNQALTRGKVTHEGWRVKKDGNFFWANIVITAIHDENNKIIGFSKVTHDLTEKKQASDQLKINAEQLELKNKELEKMNAELQSFAYVSSHDLQEPLRKIQTFATRILEKEHQNLSDNGKDYFTRMQKAANRMQTLIEDLLDYSRTNTAERIFKSTDIGEIINDVKNEFKDSITEKNATIEVNITQKANIIPFQFRQLIHNLIGNSLKFSKPDTAPVISFKGEIIEGHSLIINTALIANKNYFHLSVSDNGIGFESQYKDKIFEVFQRLHGKTEYKGTGIGLAIVKKIVENHNGIIIADGEINKGATFDIYIPA